MPPLEDQQAARQAIEEVVLWPLRHAAKGRELGVTWIKGVLLCGPPGCGKTHLVKSLAQAYDIQLHTVLASNIMGAYLGEAEEQLRQVFARAADQVKDGLAAIIFLDNLDALSPRRSGMAASSDRLCTQLLTLLDGLSQPGGSGKLSVIGATNRPHAIDPALRRAGRLDREVFISLPNCQARLEILQSSIHESSAVDLNSLAAATAGYSPADLSAVAREAAFLALASAAGSPSSQSTASPLSDQGASGSQQDRQEKIQIRQSHYIDALKKLRPSITRTGHGHLSPVDWHSIGGLQEVKWRLKQAVEWPLQHGAVLDRLGIKPPRGILLHGPPGCCKTTLIRAAAHASGATLHSLTAESLYSSYLGEGEAHLRDVFQRARCTGSAIIFLDELDSLTTSRGQIGSTGSRHADSSNVGARLLAALLTEMDGMQSATGVLVIGASNRPEAIDAALLRPGRFDIHLFVPPPDTEGRLDTLKIHTSTMSLASDVDLQDIARRSERFTGAELEALCQEAALLALSEDLHHAEKIFMRHFEQAFGMMRPSLTFESVQRYANWRSR